jgi:hypothetical protein
MAIRDPKTGRFVKQVSTVIVAAEVVVKAAKVATAVRQDARAKYQTKADFGKQSRKRSKCIVTKY